jgi:hypothetical protein
VCLFASRGIPSSGLKKSTSLRYLAWRHGLNSRVPNKIQLYAGSSRRSAGKMIQRRCTSSRRSRPLASHGRDRHTPVVEVPASSRQARIRPWHMSVLLLKPAPDVDANVPSYPRLLARLRAAGLVVRSLSCGTANPSPWRRSGWICRALAMAWWRKWPPLAALKKARMPPRLHALPLKPM